MPSSPRPAGRVNSPVAGQTSTRQFQPRAAPRRCRREGCCRLGFAIAGRVRCRAATGRGIPGTIRRPARPVQADLCCSVLLAFGRRLLAGSRPGGRPPFVATKKGGRKRPCRSAGSRRCPHPPTPGGSRRNSPWRAPDIDATIPAGRGLHSALQKGKAAAGSASPLPAACVAVVSGAAFGHDFVAPAKARVQGFGLCCSVLGVPSVGDDWPGLPRRASDFLVATRKSPKNALPQRRLAGALSSTCARRVASKLAPCGLRHRRDNSRWPRLHSALQKGKAAAGSASPLPTACVTAVSGAAFGHESRPGEGRGPGLGFAVRFSGAFGWR